MSMSMSMSAGLSQKMRVSMRVSLRDMFGETAGDIPVYSLHRISTMLERRPIFTSGKIVGILKRALIAANERYRAESGNSRWYCLTSANLEQAIAGVDARLGEIIAPVKAMPSETPQRTEQEQAKLEGQRAAAVEIIKRWFEANYDDLLYDMNGKIPWPVILRLRRKLGGWIANAAGEPFRQDIGDMVLDVARENGYRGDDPEEAWEFMGGTLMNERKPRRS